MNDTEDFNILLAMAISDDKTPQIENADNTCLISGEPLEEKYIKFDCSHCFNYENIYNEIIIQKKILNYNEIQKLSKYSMKCPYCRYIQKGILPPRKGFKKILHVNFPIKYSICIKLNSCSYVFKSGKKKGLECKKTCELEYCNSHFKIMGTRKKKQCKFVSNNIQNEKINTIVHVGDNNIMIMSNCQNKNMHPIFNSKYKDALHKPVFQKRCEHVFSRGKNKGTRCSKMMDCTGRKVDIFNLTESQVYPKYFKHYFCKQHCKYNSNKKNMVEIKNPLKVNIANISDVFPMDFKNNNNNNICLAYDKFIKKYYSKYYYIHNYKLNMDINNNLTNLTFTFNNLEPKNNSIITV